jgi:hypothetical protein
MTRGRNKQDSLVLRQRIGLLERAKAFVLELDQGWGQPPRKILRKAAENGTFKTVGQEEVFFSDNDWGVREVVEAARVIVMHVCQDQRFDVAGRVDTRMQP